jgi:hypothetical protein
MRRRNFFDTGRILWFWGDLLGNGELKRGGAKREDFSEY